MAGAAVSSMVMVCEQLTEVAMLPQASVAVAVNVRVNSNVGPQPNTVSYSHLTLPTKA